VTEQVSFNFVCWQTAQYWYRPNTAVWVVHLSVYSGPNVSVYCNYR